jgi:putative NADPH-quinone reductase
MYYRGMTNPDRKILILFAHPSLDRSEVNAELLRAASAVEGISIVDLYGEYPTYQIDIDREQQRLLEHDVVIFMFPLYWYSTPAILKEWQDLVLEYGFAYGADGTALNGKTLLCAITAGGPEEAYRAEGFNHFTLRELLRPIEQTAILCGMRFLAPFALFGSRTAVDGGRVGNHVAEWVNLLEALRDDRVDLAAAQDLSKLNAAGDESTGDKA